MSIATSLTDLLCCEDIAISQLIEDIRLWMSKNNEIQIDSLSLALQDCQYYTEKQSYHILLAITEFTSTKNDKHKEAKDLIVQHISAIENCCRQTDLYLRNSTKSGKIQKAIRKVSKTVLIQQ